MNYEYRIIVSLFDESHEIERFHNESDEDYEKRAFKEYEENIKEDEKDDYFELRKYDLDDDDYLDWDMTESKYYGG